MSFPSILQHHSVLPSKLQLNKVSERGASHRPPPIDSEELSHSWPSANLRNQLERRHRASAGNLSQPTVHPARQFLEQVPKGVTRSYESILHPRAAALTRMRRETAKDPHPSWRPQQQTTQYDHPVAAPLNQRPHKLPAQQTPDVPFSLCLTPEAILVIQKRNFERQLAEQQRSASSRRIFARHAKCPRNRTGLTQNSPLQRSMPDVKDLVKISLLNDQHRYDDMEYEDDCWLGEGDEGLVRKCTEWLQGVEMAAGRNLHDKLQTLPHLNTY